MFRIGDNVDGGETHVTSSRFHCHTADGIRLAGVHHAPPGPPAGAGGPAFVIGHGFTHATGKPATAAVLRAFAGHGAVSAVDFRGHGRSAGRSSAGRDETLDLDAAVGWTRARGFHPVTVVGFSMGAAVALRHAALGANPGDAVVSVSSPARWYVRESAPMRRLQWLLESPLRQLVGRAVGVRLGEPWLDLPASPVEAAGTISRPTLLVHGTDDAYFTPAHAIALHQACGAQMWIEAGMGHGETATTADLVARIAAWSGTALVPGAPAQP
jgi:pimeloyl-ACP methyl ester carboxylesterase